MDSITQYMLPLGISFARYFLLAGIPFLIFYLIFPEKFSRNKIQARFAQKKDFLREILYSLQTIFIITGVGLLIIKSPLRAYTQMYVELDEYPIWWLPLSLFLALLLHDSYFYWMHRTVHHPKLFRRVHLLHHKSVNPSPWASYSFHFFEALLEALIAPIILFTIPMHPISLIAFTIVAFGINVYGHLGYEIAPRWFRHSWLFEVVNTSTHHNLHHKKFKGNYGLYFRVWDRLMKTEYPDYVTEYDEIQERRFGSQKASQLKKFLIPLISLLSLSLMAAKGKSPIEGKWKDHKNGGVIEIYEENGLYFGQLISADDPEENKLIQEHGKKIILLRNFKKISETQFCCGELYAPKRKKTLDAELFLEDENTLKVDGKYGILTGSRRWSRVLP
ncbi:MAG: sterol desaturase family protein [Bacteroidota bacterium]